MKPTQSAFLILPVLICLSLASCNTMSTTTTTTAPDGTVTVVKQDTRTVSDAAVGAGVIAGELLIQRHSSK